MRRVAIGIAAIASAGALLATLRAPGGEPAGPDGVLTLRFLDPAGRATPVRVEIRDARGQRFVAEDALPVAGHCRATPLPVGLEQVLAGREREIRHNFGASGQFYADGSARTRVPAGRYEVEVSKGFEFRVTRRRYVVGAGESVADEIRLERWIDMPEAGWYGADGHLHIARPARGADPSLARWMQAEDLHVANLLQWGSAGSFHGAPQYAFGEEGVHQSGSTLLLAGQEHPRTHFLGHAVVLGAAAPVDARRSYLVYRDTLASARALGGLAGYAHFAEAFGGRSGLALLLPYGLVDFIEVAQVGRARYAMWYEALNAGFRIAPTAGSDFPCGRHLPGSERFYTRVEGELSLRSWREGVRRLRCFATNGPMLSFEVDDVGMGGSLALASGDAPVSVRGAVRFDPARDDVERLELVRDGRVVRRFEGDGTPGAIAFETELAVEETGWLALRARGTKPGRRGIAGLRIGLGLPGPEVEGPVPSVAHSAPVFVQVAGSPLSPLQVEARRAWRGALDDLARRLAEGGIEPLDPRERTDAVPAEVLRAQTPALLQAIREARALYGEATPPPPRASDRAQPIRTPGAGLGSLR